VTVKELIIELQRQSSDVQVWMAEDDRGEYLVAWVHKVIVLKDGDICLCPPGLGDTA